MTRLPRRGRVLALVPSQLFLALAFSVASSAADCNQNGMEDRSDIEEGRSADCDGNQIPDECDLTSPSLAFVVSQPPYVGNAVESLTVDDINGDGILDLVTAPSSFTVNILHGRGDGTFGEMLAFPIGGNRMAAATGDLNRDGVTDIVAAGGDSVSVLLQGPNGDFMEPLSFVADGLAVRPVVSDLDGDLFPDIATGDYDRKGVVILWNVGGDDFTPSELFPVPDSPVLLTDADLDDDGDVDLAMTTNRGTISLLENRGGRRFVAWVNFATSSATRWIGASDLDSDRDADLVAKTDDEILAFLSDGKGGFTRVAWPFTPNGECALADFEGDGLLDLAIVDDGMYFLSGNEDGGFRTPRWFGLGDVGGPLGAGDLDGDGDVDLVASIEPSHVRVIICTTVPPPESDCNSNGVLDRCELSGNDDDRNGVPDACDPDCNGNGIADGAELRNGEDCDANGVLDECQLATSDCDGNDVVDSCDVKARPHEDCNRNGKLDGCELGSGEVADCDRNGVPDECDLVGVPDASAPAHLMLGTALYSVDRADFDGDGWNDVVTLDRDSNRIWLVFAARRGVAGRLRSIPIPSWGVSVGTADLDGDTDVDLFLVHDSRITLIFNEGDGRFSVQPGSLGSTGDIRSAEDLDVDGDGDTDLVATAANRNEAWIFRNDGEGSFTGPIGFTLPPDPTALAVGDLDADGDVEVVAASYSFSGGVDAGSLAVLWNDGLGDFPDPTTVPLSGGAVELALGDLEQDGDVDAAVAVASRGAISLLVNDGGQFSAAGQVTLPGGPEPRAVLLEDLDADGAPDLAASWEEVSSIHWNDAAGRFGLRLTAPMVYPGALAAIDFEGNGTMDVVVAGVRGLAVIRNDGGRELTTAREVDFRFEVRDHALADLDGDGDLDLVAGYNFDGNRNVLGMVRANDGSGTFGPQRAVLLGGNMEHLLATDLDGDGDVDLATTNEYERCDDICETPSKGDDCDASCSAGGPVKWNDVAIVLNQGDAQFDPPVFADVGSTAAALAAADLDGDGLADLIVSRRMVNRLAVLHNRGGGSFERVQSLTAPMEPSAVGGADLDGDGLPEIVVQSTAPATTVFSNGGNGLLAPGRVYPGGSAFTFGDADADGDQDVVTTAGVFINPGDGSLLPVSLHPALANLGFGSIERADLDYDGDDDFAMVDGWRGRMSILANAGDSRLLFESGYSIAQGAEAVRVGDISGDELPDFVVRYENSSKLTFIFGRPPDLPFTDCNQNGSPDACDLASGISVDADLNGMPDECGRPFFHRGDANDDGQTNVSDAIAILNFLFSGAARPNCRESSDVNNDGAVNITDPLFLFSFLFSETRTVPPPGPAWMPCGPDPDAPEGPGDLGCISYRGC